MPTISAYPSGALLNAPIKVNLLPAEVGDVVYYSLVGPPDIDPINIATNPITIGSISDERGLEYNIWARSLADGREPSDTVQWTLITESPICVSTSYNWYTETAWGDFSESWVNPNGVPVGVMDVYGVGNIGEYGDFLGATLVVTVDGVEIFNGCCGLGNFQISIPANSINITARMYDVGCLNPLGTVGGTFNIFYSAICGGGT